MKSDTFLYQKLIEGLRLAASPHPVQQDALPGFVHLPDEVLTAVDPVEVEQLARNGRIGQEQMTLLRAYDDYLQSYPKTDEYAIASNDLAEGTWFEELRTKAAIILSALGEPYKEPSLDFSDYISAS